MVDKDQKLKVAVISGASHALKYHAANPHMTDEDVIRYISSNVNTILSKIDHGI